MGGEGIVNFVEEGGVIGRYGGGFGKLGLDFSFFGGGVFLGVEVGYDVWV